MKKLRRARFASALFCIATPLAYTSATHADVVISDKPTQNMSCDAGVCTATAPKAVLNVTDLTNMLASANTKVETGSLAKDIAVKAALSWTSASRLTLDAQHSVEVAKPVAVTGAGALTIATNDGGQNGEFLIDPKASVQFWTLTSSLIIDGNSYTLVGDIKTLAADIAASPSGFYALAKPYDASADGTYSSSPIATTFAGSFDGLGNEVSNFKMNFSAGVTALFGFFMQIGNQGLVRDFGLTNSNVTGKGYPVLVGILVGESDGKIESCWVSGTVSKPDGGNAIGGLAGTNGGMVDRSFSITTVQAQGSETSLGGLTGSNEAVIQRSYSRGSVGGSRASTLIGGGLVGSNAGQIENTYSLASVRDGKGNCCDDQIQFGGLVGQNQSGGTISRSYAAGKISQAGNAKGTLLGGLIGFDGSIAGSISRSYWDLDKGVGDPGQGAGNVENDPGITGLTTQQLQSGLPKGFSPKIWQIDSQKNKGFPYLLTVSLR